MRRIFPVLVIFFLFGCSHKYGIQQQHAFTRKITAGNIPVDEQNRPTAKGVNTTHLIYLELTDTLEKPAWDTAWIEGTAYTIQPLKIAQETITIGKIKATQEPVTLAASPGNRLWQLMLNPLQQANPGAEITSKMEEAPIVLSGWWQGKKVLYTIKKQTELETIFSE